MTSRWAFHHPVHIRFGRKIIEQLPNVLEPKKTLLITTPGTTERGLTGKIRSLIDSTDLLVFDGVDSRPTIMETDRQASPFRDRAIQQIIAVGGGSALDTGKLWSVLLHPEADSFDLNHHLKKQSPFPNLDPLSLITIPTTGGSGAEVTPFASAWDPEIPKKYSLSHPCLYPETSLVDPELTTTLPLETTVAGALDALSQCLESMWNKNARPLTDSLVADGASLVIDHLPELYRKLKENDEADRLRAPLSEASLRSGIGISQTHTAICHSISYPLTAHFNMPHGLACGITLPAVWKLNQREAPERMEDIALQLGAPEAQSFHEKLLKMFEFIEMERWYKKYISDRESLVSHSDKMFTPERAGNHIVPIDHETLQQILSETHRLCGGGA